MLEQRADQRVRVGEMAAAADVSERTLRTVFQEYFGVGPTRYLQLRKLHQIHRALQAADPEMVSASDVMMQNGEWEFGRCARRYRQLFGERPLETLHAKT
jgi:AraC family ethanolamine operon transcriptional activator